MHDIVACVSIDEMKYNANAIGSLNGKKTNNKKKESICYKCNGKDHYAHNCPSTLAGNKTWSSASVLANSNIIRSDKEEEDESDDDFTFMSYGVLCNQVDNSNSTKFGYFLNINQPMT